MRPKGVENVSLDVRTYAAAALAPVVYLVVSYIMTTGLVMVALMSGLTVFIAAHHADRAPWSDNLVYVVCAIGGAIGGIWVARWACQASFSVYKSNVVSYALSGILGLQFLGSLPLELYIADLMLAAQIVTAQSAAWYYFRSDRSPINIPIATSPKE